MRASRAGWWVVSCGALMLVPGVALAATSAGGGDLVPVLGALALILLAARAGGLLFARFGMPAVLGELTLGIVLGNLGFLGWHGFDALRHLAALDVLAQIGVLFLLFQVGLESDLRRMMAVGGSAALVATLGVIAPIALGGLASAWFFPAHDRLTHLFVGATLCATSVGITARVLSELGRTTSAEGRIILGAAVLDDVMGLVVLAVVTGMIAATDAGRAFDAGLIAVVVAKALGFLIAAVVVGQWLSRRALQLAARVPGDGEAVLLSLALAFCFGLAYLAGRVGLAPIVGAFAAGLVLDEVHYRDLRSGDRAERDLSQLLAPLAAFLVPVFFVLMGMRVDLGVFGHGAILAFAAVLTLAAIVSKQVCALGVLDRGVDRFAVGLGMIPRGEVGLIFAGIGATLVLRGERVVGDDVFSAVVVMVALTTLLTPPLLAWRLRRLKV